MASIAHAKMLCKIGILGKKECDALVSALGEIAELDKKGKFPISQEDEDCHTAIENYLVKKLGDTGKKIHTARSRNDQVLTALRLYEKDEIADVLKLCENLAKELADFKKKYGKVQMPGYTHMRKAMPSSMGYWADAFVLALEDDKKLLACAASLIDQSPLGTGAGYGAPIKLDSEMTAKLMGFSKLQGNGIHAQNSRGKFESSVLHALTQVMFDLNKMATDLALFSMPEFGYFELPQEMCTGSSLMPQKKNPDVLELVRAKYHSVLACEFEVKGIISNLPSGYNRDLQVTKEPLMKGFETAKASLEVMALVISKLKVNEKKCKAAMTPELYAAHKVHELVKNGVPFRDAYRQVAKEFEA